MREVDAAGSGHLLEERILVVPWREIGDAAAEALGEARVRRRLPGREGLGGEGIALVEGGEEPALVHLGRGDGEREPVAVAERPRGLVAEARELAHVVRDGGADRLRGLPGVPALGDVLARSQDLLDAVVVDGLAADDAAVLREPRLDRGLELDDAVPKRLGNLVRDERVVEDVQLAPDEPLGAVGPRRLDVAVERRVGERVGQRELRFDAAALVLLGRGDVRIPPGAGRCEVERAKTRLGVLEDAGRIAHARGAEIDPASRPP